MKAKKQSLKELQKIWYRKLEKSGFNDIEQDEDNLKVWSSSFSSRASIEQIQAKQAYYQMATNFLEDYTFETKRDEAIWEYHAHGISYREISKILKKVRVKMSYTSVQNVVKRLQIAMYLMYKMPVSEKQ